MSTTVDSQVVEMRFDNKQFEEGAQQSMKTLDDLKKSLKFESGMDGLKNINTQTSHIGFEGLANNVQTISNRFRAMDIVGMRVLQNLTDSAMRLGSNLVHKVLDPIKEGGKNRAMNLAQADFMMQGLLKNESKVKDVMDVVSQSVTDTAYGLDEAAIVASQFISSGITDLDKLLNSLKAVSGVAAMTGANYSEIGDIFTTVAGQGKLMASDLNRLSVRGMNGASVLGKALGKTEVEIREMVHDGEIDFKTFSEAMSNAFGEQAQKSNETFTGALANMKAALSRIGADFYEFILVDLRDIFNATKGVIKRVHGELGGLISGTKNAARIATDVIVGLLNKIDTSWIKGAANTVGGVLTKIAGGIKSIFQGPFVTKEMWAKIDKQGLNSEVFRKELKKTAKEYGVNVDEMIKETGSFEASLDKGWLTKDIFSKTLENVNKLTESTKVTKNMLEDFKKTADKVINGDFANGEERMKKLTKAGYDYGTIQNLVNKKLGSSVRHVEKLSDAQLKSQGYTKEEIKILRALAKESKKTKTPLNEILESLNKKSTGQLLFEILGNILKGLGQRVKAVADAFKKVFTTKMTVNLRGIIEYIHKLSEGFLLSKESSGKLTDGFSKFFHVVKKIIDVLISVVKFIGKTALSFVSFLTSVNDALKLGDKLVFVVDKSSGAFNILGKAVKFVSGVVKGIGKGFLDFLKGFREFFDQVKNLEGVQRLGNVLQTLGSSISSFAFDKFSTIIDFFKNLLNFNFDLSVQNKPLDFSFLLDAIDFAANKLADFIEWLMIVPDMLGGVFGDIRDKVKDFIDTLDIVPDKIKHIFGNDPVNVDSSGIDQYTDKVSNMPTSFQDAKDKIGKIISDTVEEVKQRLGKISPESVMKWVGYSSLVVLVIAVIKLINRLKKTFKGVDDVKKSFTNLMDSFSDFYKAQSTDFNASAFEKYAKGIIVLAVALKLLSTISPDMLANVVVDLGILLLIIALLMKIQASKPEKVAKPVEDIRKYIVDKVTGLLNGFKEAFAKASKNVSMAALFVSITVLVVALVAMISILSKLKPEAFKTGFERLIFIAAGIAAFLFAIVKITNGSDFKNIAASAAVFGTVTVLIVTLTLVATLLGALPEKVFNQGMTAMIGMAVGIAVFMAALSNIGDATGVIKTAAGIVILAAALAMLTPVMILLGFMPYDNILKAALSLVVLVGTLAGLAAVTLFLGSANTVPQLFSLIAALIALSVAAVLLGQNFEAAVKGLTVLTIALTIMVVAGLACVALEPGFLTLTGVLTAFGAAAAGVGVAAVGIGVGLLAASAAVYVFGKALPALAEGIVEFFKIVIENAPLIIVGVAIIIAGVAAAIISGSAAIGAAVVAVLVGVAYAIYKYWPVIWATIKSVGDWIVNRLPSIFMSVLNGIMNGVGYLISNFPAIAARLAGGLAIIRDTLMVKIERLLADIVAGIAGENNPISKGLNALADKTEKNLKEKSDSLKGSGRGYGESLADGAKEGVVEFPNIMENAGTEGVTKFQTAIGNGNFAEILKNSLGGEGFDLGLEQKITEGTDQIPQIMGDAGSQGNESFKTNFNIEDLNTYVNEGFNLDNLNLSEGVGLEVDEVNNKLGTIGDGVEPFNVNDLIKFEGSTDTSAIEEASNKVVKSTSAMKGGVEGNVRDTNSALSKLGSSKPDISGVKKAADGLLKAVSISDKVKDKVSATNKEASKLGDVKIKLGEANTKKLDDSLKKAVKNAKDKGKDAGEAYVKKMNDTISKADGTKSAGEDAIKKAASGAREARDDMEDAGKYAAGGLLDGVDALGDRLYQKGVEVGKRFVQGVKDGKALNESSPSKAMFEVGVFAIIGFINAISSMKRDVERSGIATGQTAKDAMLDSVKDMKSVFDLGLDENPVISPIIDLTNVRNGVNSINRSFGQQSIALSGRLASNAAAMMSTASNIQNRNSNFDIVNAINKLRKDISNIQGNVTNINGITYDDGSNVTSAVETLVRASRMGARA